jgi:glycine cleavage system aminomethyltransferase T
VSQWDVAVERQVQLKGREAGWLAQVLTPRNLASCQIGQAKYAPLCNHAGVLINDPLVLKLADDLYWLSIADSDIWLWARAIAAERNIEAEVSKPDVSPMAVQGPKAEDVIASIFGEWVRELKHFWFRECEIDGISTVVARSGWSKQGGFEIYLKDGSQGTRLWNIVREAGAPHGIGPGSPNWAERIESGLLSYGGDTDDQTNPFEVRLGKYVDLDLPHEVVGIRALRRIHAEGPKRHLLGVVLDGEVAATAEFGWTEIRLDDSWIGDMTNCAWSYRMQRNIGFALVLRRAVPGDRVTVLRKMGPVEGVLCELPFL